MSCVPPPRAYLCHVSDLLLHVLVGGGLGLHGVSQGRQGLTQSIGLPLGLENGPHGGSGGQREGGVGGGMREEEEGCGGCR